MNNNNALLIIDMQREDSFALHDCQAVIAHNQALLAAAREHQVPVIYTRHINGDDLPPGEPLAADGHPASYRAGSDNVHILAQLMPRPNERVIDKPRYSAFHRTDLHAHLSASGIDTLIISGVLTDVCVLTTVFDAFALGYRIQLVADACTSTTAAAHYSALLMMCNWVYSLTLINTGELLKALQGLPFNHFQPTAPDQMAHEPAQLPHAIARLQLNLQAQGVRS